MTIALLILAIIIGYLRKGRLKNLAYLEIKLVPVILLAFIIQMFIFLGYKFNIDIIQNYDILLHFVSYIILFAGLMGNLESKWFIIITVGTICNFLVIFLNGGKMPVSLEAASSIGMSVNEMNVLLSARAGTHQELHASAILWFLSDIIPISFPRSLKFLGNIYSVGDFILFAGITGLIQSAMVQHRKEEENEELSLEEIIPERQLNSFKAENHMDEIYMEDNDEKVNSSLQNEDTIIFNFEQADYDEVVAVNSIEKADLIEEVKGSKEADNVIDEIFSFDNISDDKCDQTQELFFEQNNENHDIDQSGDMKKIEEFPKDELIEEETQQAKETMLDETDFDEGIVDTIHQFIIVDGKIKENPHYNKNQINSSEIPVDESIEIQDRVNKLEEQVEELEMTQVELKPKIEQEDPNNQNLLQKITDNERVDLMKQMKQRKEKGYSLVEVEVGSKKINFWKKDL